MAVTAGPSGRGGLAVPGLLEQLADQLAQPALGRFLLEAPAPVQRHVKVVIGQVGIAHRIAAALDKADRKSTRLNSSHSQISYAVFCLKKKKKKQKRNPF